MKRRSSTKGTSAFVSVSRDFVDVREMISFSKKTKGIMRGI